jgi:hypothetical protein
MWMDDEGVERASEFEGYRTKRHEREGMEDNQWPIKRILGHRVGGGGEMEYHVQWVGFPMPKHNSWIPKSWMSGPGVTRTYDSI